MWDLATINARNVKAAEESLARRGLLAPTRPFAGATGICAKCGRDVARDVWDGDCGRCEPQEY